MAIQTGINANATTPMNMGIGGTGANLSPSNGGIVYSAASNMQILPPEVTAKLPLLSGASSAPTWGDYPIDLGGDLVIEGGFSVLDNPLILNVPAPANITVPATGTLATTDQIPASVANTMWITNGASNPSTESFLKNVPFTPTVSFFTPGDLSVVYTAQTASYYRIGNLVFIYINVAFTPTYTTASGLFLFVIPFTAMRTYGGSIISTGSTSNLIYPVGKTQLNVLSFDGTTSLVIRATGSATPGNILTNAQILTAVAYSFEITAIVEV